MYEGESTFIRGKGSHKENKYKCSHHHKEEIETKVHKMLRKSTKHKIECPKLKAVFPRVSGKKIIGD
jgi:hypothetical protein